jgi:hypothetical protein
LRRQVQDKARKEEKKSAHQKITARTYAKNYLAGVREEAIKELANSGILVAPRVKHIEQEVMPWLIDKIVDFLHEDKAAIKGAEAIIERGLEDAQTIHQNVIKQRYQDIE